MTRFNSLSARLQGLVALLVLALAGAMVWMQYSGTQYINQVWEQRVDKVNGAWHGLQQALVNRITSSVLAQRQEKARELMLRARTNTGVPDALAEGTESAYGRVAFDLEVLPNLPGGTRFGAYDLSGTTGSVEVGDSLTGEDQPWMERLAQAMRETGADEAISGIGGFTVLDGTPHMTAAGLVHHETRDAIEWYGAFGVALPASGLLSEVRQFLSTEGFPAALALLDTEGNILRRHGETEGIDKEDFQGTMGERATTATLDGNRFVRTMVPLRDADGSVQGYLASILSMKYLDRILSDHSELVAAERTNEAWVVVIALILWSVAMVAFAWVARVHLKRPINFLREEMDRISRNDLSRPVPHTEATEIGDLQVSTEAMRHTLNQQMRGNREQSTQLASASEELNASAQGLQENAQDQVKRSEEVSNSIQEVNNVVQDVANNVSEVSQAAGKVTSEAQEGTQSAQQATQQMESLRSTTENVDQIIASIQDIAKKTDLLALNAAIEAANAGDAGQGFAVVADEVRKLAEQTSNATGEINNILSQIREQVDNNAATMTQMNEVMGHIRSEAESTDQMANQIAAAAEELAATMSESTDNLGEIHTGAEQVTESVQQIRQAAGEVDNLARHLSETVQEYRLDEG